MSAVLILEPDDPRRFAELCGQFNQHLKQIEERLDVVIRHRGNLFAVQGDKDRANAAGSILKRLYRETGKEEPVTPNTVHLYLQESAVEWGAEESDDKLVTLRTRKGTITPRGPNQQKYVKSVLQHDINFGIGPAGTGKNLSGSSRRCAGAGRRTGSPDPAGASCGGSR